MVKKPVYKCSIISQLLCLEKMVTKNLFFLFNKKTDVSDSENTNTITIAISGNICLFWYNCFKGKTAELTIALSLETKQK